MMDYRKMSALSGLVIFVSFGVLLITILWLSGQRIFFTRDYIVYVKFNDVVGLRDNSQVYLRGYRVGWTKSVDFLPDGVRVRVDVNKRFQIPKDSTWEIRNLNLLGEKAVTIQPGVSKESLRQGDEVPGINKDMASQAEAILQDVREKLSTGDWAAKLRTLGDSVDKFHTLLEKSEKKIDALDVAAFNRDLRDIGSLAAELRSAGTDFRREIGETGKAGRDGLAKVERAADQISDLGAKLDVIARKIESGEGSAGTLINDKALVEDFQKTLRELQALVQSVTKNPKKYFKFSIF